MTIKDLYSAFNNWRLSTRFCLCDLDYHTIYVGTIVDATIDIWDLKVHHFSMIGGELIIYTE